MAQAYPLPRPLCQLPSLLGPPGNQVHAPRPPPQGLCCCHWLCWEQPFPGSFSPNPSLAPMSPLKTSPPTPSFPEQQLTHAHRASPARLVPHATLQSPSFLTGLFVHSQTPFTTADTNRPEGVDLVQGSVHHLLHRPPYGSDSTTICQIGGQTAA